MKSVLHSIRFAPRSTQYGKRRSGFALVVVVATLLVVMLLASSFTRAMLNNRRQGQLVEQRQQTLWLVESAVQRALQRLNEDAEFDGEIWVVTPAELGGKQSGVVEIRIMAGPADSTKRIRVRAEYPQNAAIRTTLSRDVTVNNLSPGGLL